MFELTGLFERGEADVHLLHPIGDALEGVKDGLLVAIGGLGEALNDIVESGDFGFDDGNLLARRFTAPRSCYLCDSLSSPLPASPRSPALHHPSLIRQRKHRIRQPLTKRLVVAELLEQFCVVLHQAHDHPPQGLVVLDARVLPV